MAIYLFSVSLGNQFVSIFNQFIQNPSPQIEVTEPGEYVFRLTTSDGTETVVKEMTVSVLTERPVQPKGERSISEEIAVIPPSVSFPEGLLAVEPGEELNIFAAADFGSGEGKTYYTWTVEGDEPATIADSQKRFSTFKAMKSGEYTVSLTVGTGDLTATESLKVQVTTENVPPVVTLPAEKDFVIYTRCQGLGGLFNPDCREAQPLSLSANGTYDPNGDEMTHQWELLSQPTGSTLSNEDIQGREFAYATSKITGASYYLFFAGCMLLTAFCFIPYALQYREETYIQDESDQE